MLVVFGYLGHYIDIHTWIYIYMAHKGMNDNSHNRRTDGEYTNPAICLFRKGTVWELASTVETNISHLGTQTCTVLHLHFTFFPMFHLTNLVYVLMIPLSSFQMYLFVFWKMSLVISVLEDKSGLEAFGKAWQILKGFKLQGFLLNLVYMTPVMILNMWWYLKISLNLKSYSHPMLIGLILLNVGCVNKMLLDMGFTVLYHKCKLGHEEDVELRGSLEYTKVVSNETMIGSDIP